MCKALICIFSSLHCMKEHVRYILRHFFFPSSNYTLQRGCDSNCQSIPEVHEGHDCKRRHTSSVISADSYHEGSWDLIDKVPVCYAAGALLSVLAHWQWNDRISGSKNAISLSCIWTPFRLHMGAFEVESLAEIISYLFRLAFKRAAARLQNVKFFLTAVAVVILSYIIELQEPSCGWLGSLKVSLWKLERW